MDMIGDKVLACSEGVLCNPWRPHERLEWGTTSAAAGQLRYVVDQKVSDRNALCTHSSLL